MLKRSRVSRAPDVQRIAQSMRVPGIDPRVWSSLAIVKKLVVDADEGVFVDILLMPSRDPATARVGTEYAGNGFGLYVPVDVDDEVQVEAPSGDPNEGLIVTRRLWSASDPPPADAVSKPTDVLLIAKTGVNVRIVTQGTGNVIIEPRGSGDVKLGQEAATEKAVRGNAHLSATNANVGIYNGHFHLDSTGQPTSGPISSFIPNPGFNPMLPPGPSNPINLPGPASTMANMADAELAPNVKVK